MQEFEGDLLIGGMRLRHVHGELKSDPPANGKKKELNMTGHLHLSPEQKELIELNREYRIQLDDGRGAQVVLSRIDGEKTDELLVDFVPSPRPNKPR